MTRDISGLVLTQVLLERGYEVAGYDVGFYAPCILGDIGRTYPRITKDVRDIKPADLEGVDAVIHLAALSNDPLGELAPGLTEEINLDGTLKAAAAARQAGVSRFIYSSSQSMYGISDTDAELDEDNSVKNAITSYARTKWEAEKALKLMQSTSFPSSACGHPPYSGQARGYGAISYSTIWSPAPTPPEK